MIWETVHTWLTDFVYIFRMKLYLLDLRLAIILLCVCMFVTQADAKRGRRRRKQERGFELFRRFNNLDSLRKSGDSSQLDAETKNMRRKQRRGFDIFKKMNNFTDSSALKALSNKFNTKRKHLRRKLRKGFEVFKKINNITDSYDQDTQRLQLPKSLFRKRKRPIKGRKGAFTITKRRYLRKERCKTQPFKQVIREKGCLSRTIVNNFCYGQCNSFFIPKTTKKGIEDPSFISCGLCKPRKYANIRVTLLCPRNKNKKMVRKKVLRIKKCQCIAQQVVTTWSRGWISTPILRFFEWHNKHFVGEVWRTQTACITTWTKHYYRMYCTVIMNRINMTVHW